MRKIIVFGLLFFMMLNAVLGIPLVEETYILTPEKNAIKIRFPDLTKEYNLIDEAIKENKPVNNLCEIKTTVYKGDGIIKLKAYQEISKERIKSSYDCKCKDIKKEIIDNKTGEKKTEIINICETCYIYENYIVSELIEINPDKFKINKDTEIYEVFEGCSKIVKLDNGKWGCSLWSDVSILGTEIKGATWWNVSYDYRRETLNTNSSFNMIFPFVDENPDSNGFNSTYYGQQGYIYYNNDSDFVFANDTNKKCGFSTFTDNSFNFMNECDSINNGLVAYYILDEISGTTVYEPINNYNGVYSGNFPTNITGAVKYGQDSDGDNDRVTITNDITSFNEWTLNLWIKSESLASDEQILNLNGIEGNIAMTHFFFGWGGSLFALADGILGGGKNFKLSSADTNLLQTGNWEMLTITVNQSDSQPKFYINNVLKSTITDGGNIVNLIINDNWNFFERRDGLGSDFNGGLDDIRIYNRPLTPLEIETIYNATKPISGYNPYFGSEEQNIIYPALNWTYQPTNLTEAINPTFLFNMTSVNISSVIFYHGINDTITGNFNKSFRYFKDSYVLRNCNRGEGDNQSEDNAIKYYTNDIGSFGSHRYGLNIRPLLQSSGDNWYLFNFTADYHYILENHIPIDFTNLTKELKTSQYLEIWKDNPAIVKLKTFPLEVNRTVHINVNIDDQNGIKPLLFYICNDSINPETVNPTINNNCGFWGTKLNFDTKDRTIRNSSYNILKFGIDEDGYLNLNGGIKTSETMYLIMDSEITPADKSYKLYFADDNNFNDTYLMFEGGAGWTFTNRSETPDLLFEVTSDNDTLNYYVYACNTTNACINFSMQFESLGERPNTKPTTPYILTPVTNEKVNGTYNITWLDSTDTEGNPFNVTILLYWDGILNQTLADNNITNGTEYFEWNTTGFNDSDLYEIIIYSTDSGGLSSDTTTSGFFEIDNIPVFPIATYSKRLYFYPERRFYYQ